MNNERSIVLNAVANQSSKIPTILDQNGNLGVSFAVNMLKQTKVGYNHDAIVTIYITYKLQKRTVNSPDLTLENCLFGACKITKAFDTSKCKCRI